jgi:hypothetical protein
MASKIKLTPNGAWGFPKIIDPFFVSAPSPPNLDREPSPVGPLVRTGEPIPRSGIWRPVSHDWGCPNYLWVGKTAPQSTSADTRLDYPYFPGPPPIPAHSDYDYSYQPVRWQLLWEDHRYDHGRKPGPEEAEYLSPDTEPLPWPPVQVLAN